MNVDSGHRGGVVVGITGAPFFHLAVLPRDVARDRRGGKPYLEAVGAIVAGIALGSLSMKTKSIDQGFLVHITVAALMDWLSLRRRHCTPLTLWAPDLPVGCTAETAPLRDALAWRIEQGVIAALVVLLAVVLYLIARDRRRKSARI